MTPNTALLILATMFLAPIAFTIGLIAAALVFVATLDVADWLRGLVRVTLPELLRRR